MVPGAEEDNVTGQTSQSIDFKFGNLSQADLQKPAWGAHVKNGSNSAAQPAPPIIEKQPPQQNTAVQQQQVRDIGSPSAMNGSPREGGRGRGGGRGKGGKHSKGRHSGAAPHPTGPYQRQPQPVPNYNASRQVPMNYNQYASNETQQYVRPQYMPGYGPAYGASTGAVVYDQKQVPPPARKTTGATRKVSQAIKIEDAEEPGPKGKSPTPHTSTTPNLSTQANGSTVSQGETVAQKPSTPQKQQPPNPVQEPEASPPKTSQSSSPSKGRGSCAVELVEPTEEEKQQGPHGAWKPKSKTAHSISASTENDGTVTSDTADKAGEQAGSVKDSATELSKASNGSETKHIEPQSVSKATVDTQQPAWPTQGQAVINKPAPTSTSINADEAANKPTEAAAKPAEVATTPAEAATKPAEVVPNPAEAAPKPAEVAPEAETKPAEVATQPAEATPKPVEAAPKPTEAIPKPAEAAAVPAESTGKPAEAAPTPAAAADDGAASQNSGANALDTDDQQSRDISMKDAAAKAQTQDQNDDSEKPDEGAEAGVKDQQSEQLPPRPPVPIPGKPYTSDQLKEIRDSLGPLKTSVTVQSLLERNPLTDPKEICDDVFRTLFSGEIRRGDSRPMGRQQSGGWAPGTSRVRSGGHHGPPDGRKGRDMDSRGQYSNYNAQRQPSFNRVGSGGVGRGGGRGRDSRDRHGGHYANDRYAGPPQNAGVPPQGDQFGWRKHVEKWETLDKAKNAYKIGQVEGDAEHANRIKILKKVQGKLNRLTPDNFDKLTNQLSNTPPGQPDNVVIPDYETLKEITYKVYEKFQRDTHFCELLCTMATRLSQRLPSFKSKDGQSHQFKRILLIKLQQDYEQQLKRVQQHDSNILATTGTEPTQEELEVEQQATKDRKKLLQIMHVVGHLYKQKLVGVRVVYDCCDFLMQKKNAGKSEPRPEYYEAVCSLMTVAGRRLETDKDSNLDSYFEWIRIQSENKKIEFRTRCKLMDVLELRQRDWQPRAGNKVEGPRKIAELHNEIEVQKETDRRESEKYINEQQMAKGQDRYYGSRAPRSYSDTKFPQAQALNIEQLKSPQADTSLRPQGLRTSKPNITTKASSSGKAVNGSAIGAEGDIDTSALDLEELNQQLSRLVGNYFKCSQEDQDEKTTNIKRLMYRARPATQGLVKLWYLLNNEKSADYEQVLNLAFEAFEPHFDVGSQIYALALEVAEASLGQDYPEVHATMVLYTGRLLARLLISDKEKSPDVVGKRLAALYDGLLEPSEEDGPKMVEMEQTYHMTFGLLKGFQDGDIDAKAVWEASGTNFVDLVPSFEKTDGEVNLKSIQKCCTSKLDEATKNIVEFLFEGH